MIEVIDLTRDFGNLRAVNQISFQVQPGEIFAFLGMNGAGKTTTIKMMTGILAPTSGTIRLCGFDLNGDPLQAKTLTGSIPDRPCIYGKLSGREYLRFVADLYRVPEKECESRIDHLLEEYGLRNWQDELVEEYSHGMKQRLAACAALVINPRVLILDEPMVGLDPHGARLLKSSLRRYAASGMTIFLSTHSLNVAEEIADRLAIIHKGSLIAAGTLHDIRKLSGAQNSGLEEIFLELTGGAGEAGSIGRELNLQHKEK